MQFKKTTLALSAAALGLGLMSTTASAGEKITLGKVTCLENCCSRSLHFAKVIFETFFFRIYFSSCFSNTISTFPSP